jgi:hypothetical protein
MDSSSFWDTAQRSPAKFKDISEDYNSSIFRVGKQIKQETNMNLTAISQKIELFSGYSCENLISNLKLNP